MFPLKTSMPEFGFEVKEELHKAKHQRGQSYLIVVVPQGMRFGLPPLPYSLVARQVIVQDQEMMNIRCVIAAHVGSRSQTSEI